MNIASALQYAAAALRDGGVEAPRREAELLLAALLGMDRARILARDDVALSVDALARFRLWVQERATGKPFAYITGVREFYGRPFAVSPAVLIPRPETELIVDAALAAETRSGLSALDMCCGSGALGVTLLAERPDWRAAFSDISGAALDIARKNALALITTDKAPERARFFCGDFFLPLKGEQFDVIVANPPYISPAEASTLSSEVRDHEPHLALFTPDPAALYRRLIQDAVRHLTPGGLLLVELCPPLAEGALSAAANVCTESRILRDLAGLERTLFARRHA